MKKLILILFLAVFSLTLAQEKSVFEVARNGTLQEMKMLYEKNNAVIDSVDAKTFTPLILSCYRGNIEVADFLIRKVKNLNYLSSEGTALVALCINYNKQLVENLLKEHADPNIADATGTTPLIWAVKRGNEDLVKILLQYDADRNMKDNMGITAFEYAVKSQKNNIVNLLKNN